MRIFSLLHSLPLFLLFSFLFLGNLSLSAQEADTTYDVVYLKKGGMLKGEILVFEERDGDLTFRDTKGRVYSLSREDYDYFIEDKVFAVKGRAKANRVIRPRKETEMELSVGFSAAYLFLAHNLKPDDYYLNGIYSELYFPMSFKFGAGKYLNKQNFIGLNAEFAFALEGENYFNLGLRYIYQYDAHKSNTAFYIPIEAGFNRLAITERFSVSDTLFDDNGWSYPSDRYIETYFNSLGVSLGQGVSFILNNKKSISLELSFFKNFILSQGYIDLERAAPKIDYKMSGLRFSLLYNI